jgi:phytoene desaturase
MNNKQHAIIIGAGFGGLSTACYLAKAGYQVTVIEKNERVGGRANLFEAEGYSFDMGPSWYLMPDVFEHFFTIMGEKVEDHLDLRKLDPSYRIFFKNTDQIINIHPGTEANKETFEMLEPGSYEKFLDYLKRSKYQYEVAIGDFMYKNYSSVLDFFNLRMAIEGSKLSVFSKMDTYVKRFFRTPEMQKIMQYTLVFLGSSPYNTPALYNIMTHIDFNMGVYYPMGGMHQVALAVGNVAKKHGVTFIMNTPVARINVNGENLATGVTLENGEVIEADLVVSNADRWFTETHLLEEKHREYKPSYWEKRAMAPSGLVLYLGVDGAVPEIKHHTLVFAEDWEEGFGQIFDRPQWPTDPSFYICNPSKTDPNVAPEGKENLFVLVPIAPDLDYTDESLRAYEDKILEEIEHHCGIPNFRERIEYRKSFSVKDFKEVYNSYKGTALGLAHTMMQTAAFRPDTVSKKVKNLYYAGGSTNPGNGVPICLISGELVYKRLIGDTSGKPLEKIV